MSTSSVFHLVAVAESPFVEIHILDSGYRSVPQDHHLGRVEVRLPRGLYAVRFQAGNQLVEVPVLLRGDVPRTEVRQPGPLPLAPGVPLFDHAGLHAAVPGLCRTSPVHLGGVEGGPCLLLFVQGVEEAAGVDLARGLTLHRGTEEAALPVTFVGEPGAWAGAWLSLPPGFYRLRITLGAREAVERIVPLLPGWDSLLGLGVSDCGLRKPDWRCDFARSTLVMARPGEAAVGMSEPLRHGALALLALEGERVLPPAVPGERVMTQETSPVERLIAAHLALRREQLDAASLGRLRDDLLAGWGPQADVIAFACEFAGRQGDSQGVWRWFHEARGESAPPLLFESYRLLWNAARLLEGEPPAALVGVRGQFRPAGLWNVWGIHVDLAAEVSRGATDHPAAARGALAAELAALRDLLGRREQLPWSGALSELQSQILLLLRPSLDPAWRRLTADRRRWWERWLTRRNRPLPTTDMESREEGLAVDAFLEATLLTPSAALAEVRYLLDELRHLEGRERIEAAARDRSVLAALRGCHFPCRNLLAFEDFAQEVFLRALQSWLTFRGTTEVEQVAWLKGIGRRLMADCLRRSHLDRHDPLPDEVPTSVSPQPPSAAEVGGRNARIFALLVKLTPEERDLCLRVHFHGELLADIARAQGLPADTLRKRYQRLLQRLRQEEVLRAPEPGN